MLDNASVAAESHELAQCLGLWRRVQEGGGGGECCAAWLGWVGRGEGRGLKPPGCMHGGARALDATQSQESTAALLTRQLRLPLPIPILPPLPP